jgi:hypothetical protein
VTQDQRPARYEVIAMLNRTEVFPSSFELWDFVVSFEEGSLPAAACTDQSLAVIAIWYLSLLPPTEAMERLEVGLGRNRFRFEGAADGAGERMESLADVWPRVLRRVLVALGSDGAVAIANRLMVPEAEELRPRAA